MTNKKLIKCKNCDNVFLERGIGMSIEKKFCCFTCKCRFNSLEKHRKLQKSSAEYRKKKMDYFNIWRKKNRNHFNDLMREPSRIRAKLTHAKWIEEGLCTSCGRKRDNKNFKTCLRCSKLQKIRYKNKKREDDKKNK